jgi:hypothetical protein
MIPELTFYNTACTRRSALVLCWHRLNRTVDQKAWERGGGKSRYNKDEASSEFTGISI